jgi:proteasome lid subunit RPN8/RPN11
MMISIDDKVLARIWRHGEQAYPEEGAGVLLGRAEGDDRYVVQIQPFANEFESELRNRRYMITPQDMIKAEDIAEGLGLDIIGIFHSHPDHPPRPSEFDRDRAFPWYSYLITSVNKQKAEESRSWRLTEDRSFREEQVIVKQNSKLEE